MTLGCTLLRGDSSHWPLISPRQSGYRLDKSAVSIVHDLAENGKLPALVPWLRDLVDCRPHGATKTSYLAKSTALVSRITLILI